MSVSTGTGWAQLRQQARSLESQTEALFHTYSQFSTSSNIATKATEDEQKCEAQIQDILEKREALLSQLTRLLDSESVLTSSALKQNNLLRHREILLDHRHEFSRLRSSLHEARNRANLLPNVRSDIAAYRSSSNSGAGAAAAAEEAEYMLDERRRIDNSHSMTDGILSQAYAINESFGTQRETLASINRRIVGAASQVPGINSLIGRIGAKKRRDGIILGAFIAICFLGLLYFR